MTKQQFQDLKISFNCRNDPTTQQPINLQFTADEFVETRAEDAVGLFKLCAMKMGLTTQSSIKYQVLCDTTAMIGVVKQKGKNVGELEQIDTVQFGK